MEPRVKDITITDMSPQFSDPTLRKLMPTRLRAERMSMILSGSDAIANGLRRTLMEELPVMRMTCEYNEIVTDDAFIIREMLIRRLRCVPVDQRSPMTARYELVASNTGLIVRDVKMSEFKVNKGDLPFNGTTTLCTLQPGKSIRITTHMVVGYGYVNGEGMCALGFNAVSLATDVAPFDAETGLGTPSRQADPRRWRVAFTTNGELPCREIVVRSAESIVARMSAVKQLLYSIEYDGVTHKLTIPGESHTLGNLIMRTTHDLYPDIPYVVYDYDSTQRICTVMVRGAEDINALFDAVIRYATEAYRQIARDVSAK